MDTVVLGRTGLEVSVAGLGCGGHSRLGQSTGSTEDESVDLVRRALDLGITYIDTAHAYGTEAIVGKGIAGRRDEVVLSTKASPEGRDGPIGAAQLRESVHRSLRELQTDHVEVFHLHGVSAAVYPHCREVLVPELLALRDEGAVRHLAVSEGFGRDASHQMLAMALPDDCFDVAMVGFNLLNPSARERVLPLTTERGVGVEVMFAVRRALSHPEQLREVARQLVDERRVGEGQLDLDDPLGFLVHESGAASVVEAAYRFARHEPGCDVVLTGTGNPDHLEENVASICGPPLPEADLERLRSLFGHLDHLSGN